MAPQSKLIQFAALKDQPHVDFVVHPNTPSKIKGLIKNATTRIKNYTTTVYVPVKRRKPNTLLNYPPPPSNLIITISNYLTTSLITTLHQHLQYVRLNLGFFHQTPAAPQLGKLSQPLFQDQLDMRLNPLRSS